MNFEEQQEALQVKLAEAWSKYLNYNVTLEDVEKMQIISLELHMVEGFV